jgi:hypothetical protein
MAKNNQEEKMNKTLEPKKAADAEAKPQPQPRKSVSNLKIEESKADPA